MMIVNVAGYQMFAIPQTIIASPNMGSAMIVKVINDNTCFWSTTTIGQGHFVCHNNYDIV